MQNLIIFIIVAIAAVYVGCRFYRSFKAAKTEDPCSCGCSSCGTASTCDQIQERPPE